MSEKEAALSADAEMAETQENSGDEDTRVYEIGLHVVPSGGEEGAQEEFTAIRAEIARHGGSIISEEAPTLLTLAYKMQKDIDRKRYTYTNAYFGWIKCDLTPEAAHALKDFVANRKHVLRYLLIKTTRETFVRQLPQLARERHERALHKEGTAADAPAALVPETPMTVEAMDAEIDKLIVE